MSLDLDALEKVAREATPGEWVQAPESGKNGWYSVEVVNIDGQGYDVALRVTSAEDAAHIAAFDPETALALIAEVRELRAKLDAVKRIHVREPGQGPKYCADCDQLLPCPTIEAIGEADE